ncbi:HPr(Ser) kinase/phosphatase [Parasphaerochaeta coccoides]|uniref:HPr kinase/phosphorylase n=1 Tax=Parasphaerochaeta coccoides (strain ATCC BAA-1237 / DSM 17374 / SPN1) TaxID=760011 RepID=F4GJP3_PARC1|nr:HPr(Ser) kinase/phosphatase [Parasphaerochaeta coccoides]AEC02790.1 Hpr(Ser) kinase/phosphatase [Parasphaerochaeta coccoides DSM 17374]
MKAFTILDLLDLDLKEHNILELSCIAGRSGLSRKITTNKISRPGLPLSGYFDEFSVESIQVFGRGEQHFLAHLEVLGNYEAIEKILSSNVPCCIFSDMGTPSAHFIKLAEENSCAILQTPLPSSDFSRHLYQLLDAVFAPTITIHAVMVEVFGIGVLITGDSGVGKSETALELIERGHRLISDDTVKLRNIGDNHLIGSGENPLLAHHMEIRGLGIINVAHLFGVGAIRERKQVQLVVKLDKWESQKDYDRIGSALEETILGISIPMVEIPVKPGRNVPILIETAARTERLKKLGYYSSKDFDQTVVHWLESQTARSVYYDEEKP